MVLFDTDISPFEQVNVALDLETTGLDSNRHAILDFSFKTRHLNYYHFYL